MAKKFEIRFGDDGKMHVEDVECIRRIRWLLEQDRRLTMVFEPKDPRAYVLNHRCPAEIGCPTPGKICPDPADLQCPMYLRDVPLDIQNAWVREENWKNLSNGGPE